MSPRSCSLDSLLRELPVIGLTAAHYACRTSLHNKATVTHALPSRLGTSWAHQVSYHSRTRKHFYGLRKLPTLDSLKLCTPSATFTRLALARSQVCKSESAVFSFFLALCLTSLGKCYTMVQAGGRSRGQACYTAFEDVSAWTVASIRARVCFTPRWVVRRRWGSEGKRLRRHVAFFFILARDVMQVRLYTVDRYD